MTRAIRHGTEPGIKTLTNGLLGVGVGSFIGSADKEFKKQSVQLACRLLNKKFGVKCPSQLSYVAGGGVGGGAGRSW
jgi:hypothetical protein